MKLKYILILLIFSAIGFQATAQELKEEIRKATEEYIEINQKLDVDGIMEKVYPKIFDIVPKEAFKQQYKQLFESEEMLVGFGSFFITDILDKTVKYKGETFGIVRYKFDMTMKFKDNSADEYILAAFNEQYGEDKVSYDKETSTFSLNMDSEMFAIKSDGKWYFLENKPELEAIIGQLIPDEVREKFGDAIKSE
ncbi:MAG: hypothetical protein AB8G11_26270 [Saprospiraceae bacterium]